LTPATRGVGLTDVPGFIVTVTFPLSIFTGFKTFHLPSGNFWNELHGALPVCANTGIAANITMADAKAAGD